MTTDGGNGNDEGTFTCEGATGCDGGGSGGNGAGAGAGAGADVETETETGASVLLRCETASHSPLLVQVSCGCCCPSSPARSSCCCSRARRSSHRARSTSARARTVALCRRHSATCDEYSACQASNSAGDTEDSGDVAVVAVGESTSSDGPAGAGSVEMGGAVGWKGATRGRLGTENGSERAA